MNNQTNLCLFFENQNENYRLYFQNKEYIQFERGNKDSFHVVYLKNSIKYDIKDIDWMNYIKNTVNKTVYRSLYLVVREVSDVIIKNAKNHGGKPLPTLDDINLICNIIKQYNMQILYKFIFIFYYLMNSEWYYKNTKLCHSMKMVCLHMTLFSDEDVNDIAEKLKNGRSAYNFTVGYIHSNGKKIITKSGE